jgi:nicotinamidase-related amidase
MKQDYIGPAGIGGFTERMVSRLEGTRARGTLPDLARASLVVLDLQRIFVDPASPAFLPAWRHVAPRVRDLLAAFGQYNLPVVRSRHIHAPGDGGGTIAYHFGRLLMQNDPLAGWAEGWDPDPGDRAITKPRHSVFARTSLAADLTGQGVRVVVLAGVQAHLCVLASAVEAGSHDLLPVVALDAVAAPDAGTHEAALLALSGGLAWIATVDEITRALRPWGSSDA